MFLYFELTTACLEFEIRKKDVGKSFYALDKEHGNVYNDKTSDCPNRG